MSWPARSWPREAWLAGGFAASFGYIMTLMQLPLKMTIFLTSLSDNKYFILLLINLMLLCLGTMMDMAPLILIMTPILLPLVKSLGIDPVHFGMVMIVNLGMELITPPVGSVLFVGSVVARLRIEQLVKALMPFYFGLLLVLLVITYVPAIPLFIPWLAGMLSDQQFCIVTGLFCK